MALKRSLTMLVTVAFATITAVGARAQLVGEWNVIDSIHAGRNNSYHRQVETAGPGRFLVFTHEDYPVGPKHLRLTSDGGRSWRVVLENDNYRWTLREISYPSSKLILVIGDSLAMEDYPVPTRHPFVMRTTNEGATWTTTSLGVDVVPRSIDMLSDTSGVVLTFDETDSSSTLKATTNGGMSWYDAPLARSEFAPTHAYATAPARYFVTAYDTVGRRWYGWTTEDGGSNWHEEILPEGLIAFHFVGELDGWAVGQASLNHDGMYRDIIYKSRDAGRTWTVNLDTLAEPSLGLRSVSFSDELNGVAGGDWGKLYRTTDGGDSWTRDFTLSSLHESYTSTFGDVAQASYREAMALGGSIVLKYDGHHRLKPPTITSPSEDIWELPFDVGIRWTPIVGATEYDIQVVETLAVSRVYSPDKWNTLFLDRRGIRDTSIDLRLGERKLYEVRVRARSANDTSDWSMVRTFVTRYAATSVLTPHFTYPRHVSKDVPLPVTFTWTSEENATGYDFYLKRGDLIVDLRNYPDTSTTVLDLLPGVRYSARVRSRRGIDTSINWSRTDFVTAAATAAALGIETSSKFAIIPNPVTEATAVVNFASTPSGSAQLDLFDVHGALVHRLRGDSINPSGTIIDLNGVPSGVYFLRVSTRKATWSERVIVVR